LTLPAVLSTDYPEGSGGTATLDWWRPLVTNAYPLARLADLPSIVGLATTGDLAVVSSTLAEEIAAIPTNVVGGWLVWDSGSNRYWRVSATNLRFYVWGDL
jgi:hypothetical protein